MSLTCTELEPILTSSSPCSGGLLRWEHVVITDGFRVFKARPVRRKAEKYTFNWEESACANASLQERNQDGSLVTRRDFIILRRHVTGVHRTIGSRARSFKVKICNIRSSV